MKTCNCLALWGAIIGICGGVVVAIPATAWWVTTSPLHWYTILISAPFFGGIWGAFGGFVAGIVPPSAMKRVETTLLLTAFAGAVGGGAGGLAFGQLIDRGQGLATPLWALIGALSGALCAVLASVRGVCAISPKQSDVVEDPEISLDVANGHERSNIRRSSAKVSAQEILR